MRARTNCEPATEYKGAFAVKGWGQGIAFRVIGWETEPDEDTEWSGIEERTGNLVVCMIGDDRHHSVDPSDVTAIPRSSYCGECGQIGCHCDGYDDSDKVEPGMGDEAWELAYRRWRKLADRGYGERCYTPFDMEKADKRIRKAKEKYERLLGEWKAKK